MREFLNYQDLFLRECFKPMHLMKVNNMFALIDEVNETYNFQLEQKNKANFDTSLMTSNVEVAAA